MKFAFVRVCLFSSLLFLFSCESTKELTLLQQQMEATPAGPVKSIPINEREYKLRPADRLLINVFSLTDERVNFLKDPEIERVVDAKGQVELPVIGMIAVGGNTVKEAEEKIKKTAADYLRSPSVAIKVTNFQVTVLGEVTSQGSLLVPEPRINLLEALGRAGGFTENADRRSVRIVRKENGDAKIYVVNLLDEKSLSSKNFNLQTNDIVLVNPRKATSARQNRLTNIGLFASLSTSVIFLVLQLVQNN